MLKGKGDSLDILPLGGVDRTPLEFLVLGLKLRFGKPVELLPDQPLPEAAYDPARGQWLARDILRAIKPRPGAWRTLGVAGVDLYSAGLTFVFGEADRAGRRAIFSLERLRPEHAGEPADRELLLGRSLKEAVHEIGHTLGLGHCRDRSCVMRFSNSLADTDLKRDSFCERCRKAAAQRLGSPAAAGAGPRAR